MERILVTGGSGYVGRLVAAALLARTRSVLIVPVRQHHDLQKVRQEIVEECLAFDPSAADIDMERLRLMSMRPGSAHADLPSVLREERPSEVIHCAGCLDYFDQQELKAVNVDLTGRLLAAAEACGVNRFIFVSTAFSSGYVRGGIAESPHGEPERDPTTYTRTKRAAEHLVRASKVPSMIVRPSILIGHSRSGRYTGRQYGLYQLWSGIERFLCTQWEPELHVVAPLKPLNLVHQDAFQEALLAARDSLGPDAILNIVSRRDSSPLMRDLWNLWIDDILRPERRFYYERLDDLPVHDMPRRQRALMALASVNLEIATHDWLFDSSAMDALEHDGLDFVHATFASVHRCHDRFVEASPTVQRFRRKLSPRESPSIGLIDSLSP